MKKKKKNKSTIFTLISMLLILGVGLGVFYWQVNKTEEGKVETGESLTEEMKLLTYDMENQYPQTPREVVRLYCRMTKLLYSGELQEEQIESLVDNVRALFDEDLLEANPRETHLEEVDKELKEYQDKQWKITRYSVEDAKDSDTVSVEGRDSTTVRAYFSRQEGKATFKDLYELFILREDEEGRFKILGWSAFDPEGEK